MKSSEVLLPDIVSAHRELTIPKRNSVQAGACRRGDENAALLLAVPKKRKVFIPSQTASGGQLPPRGSLGCGGSVKTIRIRLTFSTLSNLLQIYIHRKTI